jgi:hypothetical protein
VKGTGARSRDCCQLSLSAHVVRDRRGNKFNLRFAHRGRGTFLCFAKEKYPKERRPRLRATPPEPERLLGPARSHAASCREGTVACIHARDPSGFSQKAFGLGRAPRGINSSTPIWPLPVCCPGTADSSVAVEISWLRLGVSRSETPVRPLTLTPVGASRASQPAPGVFARPCSSPSGVVQPPASWSRARCWREAQGTPRVLCEGRSDRGVFLLGTFLYTSKEKYRARGARTAS